MNIKEITVNLSAVIPTGSYQNYKPMYELKAELTEADDAQLCLEQLRETIRKLFTQDWTRLRDKDKSNFLANVRWYEKDGKKLPSVTSVLGWAELNYKLRNPEKYQFGGVSEDDLQEYGARGTVVHRQAQDWFESGMKADHVMKEEFPELVVERQLLKESNLKVEDCSFLGFIEKHGKDFTFQSCEQQVIGEGYAGRLDFVGTYKGRLAIIDIKTTSTYTPRGELQYFKQLAAYAKATELDIKDLVIIPLNPSNKCGYGAPKVVEMSDNLFNSFNEDLKAFERDFKDLI